MAFSKKAFVIALTVFLVIDFVLTDIIETPVMRAAKAMFDSVYDFTVRSCSGNSSSKCLSIASEVKSIVEVILFVAPPLAIATLCGRIFSVWTDQQTPEYHNF